MRTSGKLHGISKDIMTKKYLVTFAVEALNSLENLAGEELDIEAKKHRNRRSLDANAYAWVLMSKIADVAKTSKDEVYEEMLQKYGCFYQDDKGYITITVKRHVDMSKVSGHWKFIRENDGFKSYLMIKGSSEYNTEEMSHFIDGIVSEAEDLNIETATPNELERMKALWQTSGKVS